MRLRPVHATVIIALAAACHPGFLPAREIGPGEAVQLRVGESGRIRGTDIRFRVDSIADSRCPADVTCVWAGAATVWYTVLENHIARRSGPLGLRPAMNWAPAGPRRRIELVDVQPMPRRAAGMEPQMATIAVDVALPDTLAR